MPADWHLTSGKLNCRAALSLLRSQAGCVNLYLGKLLVVASKIPKVSLLSLHRWAQTLRLHKRESLMGGTTTTKEWTRRHNDSPYGLGGSVITKNINRGKRIARQIDTGMVFINQATWTAPALPFGGVKNSGYGRELAELGIGEFVNKKLIHVAA
jgi:Aldehyde dehydrogenase family